MRRGLYLPNQGDFADPATLAEVAAAAESAGLDGVFVWDEIVPVVDHSDSVRRLMGGGRAVGDPFVALTAVALATTRIRFGALVTPLARLRPEAFALATATLDRLSGGRLVVGAGLGSPDDQFSAFGLEASPLARARLLDEHLEVLGGLWSGEVVEHRGPAYTVAGVAFDPPAQQPRIPVWIGGGASTPAVHRRAARWDGFVPASHGWPDEVVPVDEMAAAADAIARARAAVGLEGTGEVVVIGGASGRLPADLAAYEEAGATWALAQAFTSEGAESAVAALAR